jgi:hypothetical protein
MTKHRSRWIFVDDSEQEAQAFADALSRGDSPIEVVPMVPATANAELFSNKEPPAGVLMDVDLSNAPGQLSTGPGIAQNIRVQQRAGKIHDFPIVRFAGTANVRRNVGGDPTSEDLFDWQVMKEQVSRQGAASVWCQLQGIENVYCTLPDFKEANRDTFPALVGLNLESWEAFGHPAFADRVLASLQVATHVAAGAFLRSFLLPPGLLIDEALLAVRFGVDSARSGAAWQKLLASFDFRYQGSGAVGFARWWARGLDEWWARTSETSLPLSSCDLNDRVAQLTAAGHVGLVAAEMPAGSAGNKPWQFCSLSQEREPPAFIQLDPAESIRMIGTTDLAPWVDPRYAALGPALQQKNDFRLNSTDLDRLRRKYR